MPLEQARSLGGALRVLQDAPQCLLVIIARLARRSDRRRSRGAILKELLLDLKRCGLTIGPELAVAERLLPAIEECAQDLRPTPLSAYQNPPLEEGFCNLRLLRRIWGNDLMLA
jgi:hypothetical protein